ncbi:M23 family metallopeptidase [Georgenia faecalis]|uniref:M23 family metallopeptidase n=1 Tax=Georgenia faecalis TaxID=2483799 RepID=UPI000FD79C0E|nr:M23 family metallopeptidase [Georgenia faecalis]
MKRTIARGQTWWWRLFVVAILANLVLDIPQPYPFLIIVGSLALALVRPPATDRGPVDVAPPVRGRWVALNSPGSAVPSHGVKAYGQKYAVDLLQPSTDAPPSMGWSFVMRRPETYPTFGAPVHAMAAGTVVHAQDGQRDHRARDTWPGVLWMMTLEGFIRELAGARKIMGNHVVVEHDDGTYAAYGHLRHGSAVVRPGEHVAAGQVLAQVGNTGNTSEPHLHVQLMDDPQPTAAAGVPMRWPEIVVDPAERDARWGMGEPKPTALPGFPRNGQIFEVRESSRVGEPDGGA